MIELRSPGLTISFNTFVHYAGFRDKFNKSISGSWFAAGIYVLRWAFEYEEILW